MKVFKMDKAEILEAEIKRKIILIQNLLFKSRSSDSHAVESIPKYLDSISTLKKENADLISERQRVADEHTDDLKQIEELLSRLSKLVENDHA